MFSNSNVCGQLELEEGVLGVMEELGHGAVLPRYLQACFALCWL